MSEVLMNVMTQVVNAVMLVLLVLFAAFLLLDWYTKRH